MNPTTVLVVGAGPTGLVLAHELQRHGVRVRLVEKLSHRSERSKALGIHARTIETFQLMGVADEFLAVGLRTDGMAMYSRGRRIARLPFSGIASAHPFVLIVPQNETERILETALLRRGLAVERAVELVGFTPRAGEGNGHTVALRHANGEVELASADWIVGCDGAHSTVRHLLEIPFEGAAYPEPFLLADVAVEGTPPPSRTTIDVHLVPQGLLAFFPLPNGRMRIIASRPPADLPAEPTLAQCQAVVDERLPGRFRLSDPAWTAFFRIHHRTAPVLRRGGVFLAGDAAHIHSPAGGQGMNAGIQDAFNLAWKIGLVARGAFLPALLDSYEGERLPVDHAIVAKTDLLTRQAELRGPLRWLRDRVMSWISSCEKVRHALATNFAQLAVRYGGLFIENHSLPAGPAAGERAPDVRLRRADGGGAAGLYGFIAEGNYTLLLLAGAKAPDLARLASVAAMVRERLPSPKIVAVGAAAGPEPVWIDAEGAVAKAYGETAAVYLVRPDGYIAFRAPLAVAARRLPAYLDRLVGPLPA